jgi:hypothetical protein
MAFGDLKGTLVGNAASITNPFSATGSVAVSVGDLVYTVIGEVSDLTVTACSDNLGNTYVATNAGTVSPTGGNMTGRCYYSRVTVAGTLTSISFATTASNNNVSVSAQVIEGSFAVSPLDANPANDDTDLTSPFTCPATGTLAQADEVVLCWRVHNGLPAFTATSPNIEAVQESTASISTVVGYQTVAATTSVSPAFTSGTSPTSAVAGTNSFKKVGVAGDPFVGKATRPNPTAAPRASTLTATSDNNLLPFLLGQGKFFGATTGPENPRAARRAPTLTSTSDNNLLPFLFEQGRFLGATTGPENPRRAAWTVRGHTFTRFLFEQAANPLQPNGWMYAWAVEKRRYGHLHTRSLTLYTLAENEGSGAADMAAFIGEGTGERIIVSTGAAAMAAFIGTGVPEPQEFTGTGAADMAAFIGDGEGQRLISPDGGGVLPAFIGAGVTERSVTGTGAGVMAAFIGDGLEPPPPFAASGRVSGWIRFNMGF